MPLYLSSGEKQGNSNLSGDINRYTPKFFYMCGRIVLLLMAAMVSAAVAIEKNDLEIRRSEPHGSSMTAQGQVALVGDQSVAYDEKSVGRLDPDTLLRRFILPGVVLLVLIFAAVLIAIFFRDQKQSE